VTVTRRRASPQPRGVSARRPRKRGRTACDGDDSLAVGERHGRPLPPKPDGISDRQTLAIEDPSQLTGEQCLGAALGFV
jgi:hypothetical protein